jgi:hypothetical protein
MMHNPALVSLTFDDGFRCQFEKALPVLKRHSLLATFFLIANCDANHDRWLGHTTDWWKIDWRDDDVNMLKQLDKAVMKSAVIASHMIRTRCRCSPILKPVNPNG